MSEYLSKKAVLEWLKKRLDETQFVREAYALAEIVAKIECGRFDAKQMKNYEDFLQNYEDFQRKYEHYQTEIQRLRAALVEIKQLLNENRENDGAFQSWNHMQAWKVATQALSTTTEPTGPYTVRRDEYSHAVAIERNGYTVLHLQPGTERNEQEVEFLVAMLNGRPPEDHLLWDIKGLLENWDFRGIAEQLPVGFEEAVVVELVELCERLTGAKSPRVNAPEA